MTKREENLADDIAVASADAVMREFLGYTIKRAYLVLHHAAADALAGFDLKVRSFSALSLIAGNPGITPSELADMLEIERSNLVLIIDDLETRDLISRTQKKTDRRRYALNATLRGRHLRDKAAAAIRQADERPLLRLSDAERQTLVTLLNKIEAGGA